MYQRKTKEELLKDLEQFQHESLFKAYSCPFNVGGTVFTAVELWSMAKDVVREIYNSPNKDMYASELYSIYRRDITGWFDYIPEIDKRRKSADDLCIRIFHHAALMVYHCMTCDEELGKELVYEPTKKRYTYYGIFDGKLYTETTDVKSVYQSICCATDPFFSDLNYYAEFYERYKDNVEEKRIEYDYNYCKGEPTKNVTDTCRNIVEQPQSDIHNIIFKDEFSARLAHQFINENKGRISSKKQCVVFFLIFYHHDLLKAGCKVKEFCDQINHPKWFGEDDNKNIVSIYSSLQQLACLFNVPPSENTLLGKEPNKNKAKIFVTYDQDKSKAFEISLTSLYTQMNDKYSELIKRTRH